MNPFDETAFQASHQINIADSGYGSRGPRVFNDRAGEVGRSLNIKDFDCAEWPMV